MASTIRVISTITNSVDYVEWISGPSVNSLPVRGKSVLIQGGAGVAEKRTFITKLGISTIVNEAQLEFLLARPAFQRHMRLGFLKVVKTNADPEIVASDMTQRDGSAPYVPNDFPDGKQPKTGSDKPVSAVTTKPRYVAPKNDFR